MWQEVFHVGGEILEAQEPRDLIRFGDFAGQLSPGTPVLASSSLGLFAPASRAAPAVGVLLASCWHSVIGAYHHGSNARA